MGVCEEGTALRPLALTPFVEQIPLLQQFELGRSRRHGLAEAV